MSVELLEQEIWAIIWKAAPQMEGSRPLEKGDQEIIDQISRLRADGKLNSLQCQVLDQIGMNKLNKNKKRLPSIPRFKNEDGERDFWDKHSVLDFPHIFKPVKLDFSKLKPSANN